MKTGPCPPERPSAVVMAWASSCSRHHDGVCSGTNRHSRSAVAVVAVAWCGSGSTLGGCRSAKFARACSAKQIGGDGPSSFSRRIRRG
jgi:hypothetical protein